MESKVMEFIESRLPCSHYDSYVSENIITPESTVFSILLDKKIRNDDKVWLIDHLLGLLETNLIGIGPEKRGNGKICLAWFKDEKDLNKFRLSHYNEYDKYITKSKEYNIEQLAPYFDWVFEEIYINKTPLDEVKYG